MENQGVFVWSAESSLSLSLSVLRSLFFFGHHDWTDKHVVVTAETVNVNTDDTRPLEFIGGLSRCFNQNTHTTTKKKKKTVVPNLERLVSKIVSELVS